MQRSTKNTGRPQSPQAWSNEKLHGWRYLNKPHPKKEGLRFLEKFIPENASSL